MKNKMLLSLLHSGYWHAGGTVLTDTIAYSCTFTWYDFRRFTHHSR